VRCRVQASSCEEEAESICQSTHVNKRAQGFPDLISQALYGSHRRVIGHPAKAKAEVEKAGTERLSNKAEPLKWLFYFNDRQLSGL
jgi:hypothetical protein